MSFSVISDIHIKSYTDKNYQLLLKFMKSDQVKASQELYFLGDIFDLVIGGHQEYYLDYKEFFNLMIELSWKGKEIHFFEGNHDFHIQDLFNFLVKEKGLKNFRYHKDTYVRMRDGKAIAFSHGDMLDVGNTTYIIWKKFINNPFMKLVTTDLWSYDFVQNLGNFLSKKSRKRNTEKYENPESQDKIRELYRKTVLRELANKKWDVYICGHSHVQENFQQDGKHYLNCGYLPKSQSFIYFNESEFTLINL